MSDTGLKPKYQCDECGEIHDDVDDAHDCCQPKVIEGYRCPVCLDFHHKEQTALDCCGFDPDAPQTPPPPTAAELESAGQLRLLP